MHTIRFYSALLITALVCAGCAGTNAVKDDFNFAQNPGKGVIAFSTRWDFNCETGMIGEYSYINYKMGNESVHVNLHNPFLSDDFKNPPGRMIFNVASAGTHKVDEVDFVIGERHFNMALKKPIEIPVKAGKVNYAGELTFKVSSCGIKMMHDIAFNDAKVSIQVSNQWKRDRGILMKQHPELMKGEAAISLMHQ